MKIRDYNRVMQRIVDEVFKTFPRYRFLKGFAKRALRRESEAKVTRAIERVGRIISDSVFTQEERKLLASLVSRYNPEGEEEKKVAEGVMEKLKMFGILGEPPREEVKERKGIRRFFRFI
jgi:hypothetical protein